MNDRSISQYLVIINPNAGRRCGERDWPLIADLLNNEGISFISVFTKKRLDAIDFARQGIEEGFRKIIIVGGDGTLNEAVNGAFAQSVVSADEVTFAMIPIGTGNDWGKMYAFPSGYGPQVKMIADNFTLLQDAGLAIYYDSGSRTERYFVNIAGIGCDAVVTQDANRRKERGQGGKIAYMISLMLSLFKYSHRTVTIEADNNLIFKGALYSANIGICRYSGGGMMQVPFAIPDDGLFDITVFRKMSKFKVIRNAPKLYDGSFVKMKQVSTHRAAAIKVFSNEKVLLEADGESLGTLPVEFSILPKAVRIVIPRTYLMN